MSKISFQGAQYACKAGGTVLDTLLENGADVPFSCKSGVCQTCLMRYDSGTLPAKAQDNVRDTLRAQGYFLSCQCMPEGDLSVLLADDLSLFGRASVMDKKPLADDIWRLSLLTSAPMYYRAGQFINLRNPDGVIRSYSLASVPMQQEHLELHIRRHPRGVMSNWLCDEVQAGELLDFQGPNGSCFYVSGQPERELLLIGTGTGLAPLLGIARDALYSGHKGKISLYHGSHEIQSLYCLQALEHLAMQNENFHYYRCVSGPLKSTQTADEGLNVLAGRADDLALQRHTDLGATSLFLCGAPPMVESVQRRAYLAGADLSAIHADPFLTRQDTT